MKKRKVICRYILIWLWSSSSTELNDYFLLLIICFNCTLMNYLMYTWIKFLWKSKNYVNFTFYNSSIFFNYKRLIYELIGSYRVTHKIRAFFPVTWNITQRTSVAHFLSQLVLKNITFAPFFIKHIFSNFLQKNM